MAENSPITNDRSLRIAGLDGGSLREASATKRDIALAAADLASVEGLEGLSLGRLAAELEMSKSGLYAHFRSKEELQLAAIDAAAGLFAEALESRAQAEPDPGAARARALVEGWLDYLEGETFSGGCFFLAAAAEFDDRPGPVRDRLVELTRAWATLIEDSLAAARKAGAAADDLDPAQTTFEVLAFLGEANRTYGLLDDGEAFDRARRAITAVLARAGL
jgi:AcrR family transcriptional regulator